MNEKQLQQAFIQFLAQKSGAKTLQELEKYIQSLGEEGIKQAQQEFITLVKLQQALKAAHGAKLQYFRKLKNQCSEGEELVYYKRGGTIDCGCVKKGESGMLTSKGKKESIVDKFKRKAKEVKNKVIGNKESKPQESPKKNKYGEYTDKHGNMIITKEGMNARQKELDNNKTTDKEIRLEKCGGKTKKKIVKNELGGNEWTIDPKILNTVTNKHDLILPRKKKMFQIPSNWGNMTANQRLNFAMQQQALQDEDEQRGMDYNFKDSRNWTWQDRDNYMNDQIQAQSFMDDLDARVINQINKEQAVNTARLNVQRTQNQRLNDNYKNSIRTLRTRMQKFGGSVEKDKCGTKVKKKACGAKVEKEKCGNKVVAKFKNRKK